MDNPWIQLITTIVGALLAILGGFAASSYANYQERKALCSAHAGEIRANLSLLTLKDRIPQLVELIKDLEANQSELKFFKVVPSRYEYNRVFTSTANRLGMLPSPLPEEIVHVHYNLQLILEVLENNNTYSAAYAAGTTRYDPAQNLKRHRDLLLQMQEFVADAADLIDALDSRS